MKAYQGLHKPSRKSFFIMVEDEWHVVEAKGLPDFCELRDEKGIRVALWRDVDIQELPTMDKVPAGRTAGAS